MIDAWMYSVIVLGLLIALGGTFLSHLSPRLGVPRRWLWLALMTVSVSLPVGVAWRAPRPEPAARDLSAPPRSAPPVTSRSAEATFSTPVVTRTSPRNYNDVLLVGWAAASLLLAGIFALSHRRIRRELAACERRQFLGSTVVVSPDFGPAAVGLLRSEVVLPEWVFDLADNEQQLVLRHELEHIRAGDHFVLLAGVTLAVLMPWNLGLWWQLRRLRVGMEVDCDARVAPTSRERPRYAELLLRARNQRKVHRLALALVPAPSALAERLMALLESAKLSPRQCLTWSVSALACAVVVTRVPVPALKALGAPALPARVVVTGVPANLHPVPPSDRSGLAPGVGAGISSAATSRQYPRYDSLIPIPVVGAPEHPRYDSLVPYVQGRPSGARGGFVGRVKTDSAARPDSGQEASHRR